MKDHNFVSGTVRIFPSSSHYNKYFLDVLSYPLVSGVIVLGRNIKPRAI
jgi:hypothetical protein